MKKLKRKIKKDDKLRVRLFKNDEVKKIIKNANLICN